jgi:hypothetical protein
MEEAIELTTSKPSVEPQHQRLGDGQSETCLVVDGDPEDLFQATVETAATPPRSHLPSPRAISAKSGST